VLPVLVPKKPRYSLRVFVSLLFPVISKTTFLGVCNPVGYDHSKFPLSETLQRLEPPNKTDVNFSYLSTTSK
jgi:hypothetical protein